MLRRLFGETRHGRDLGRLRALFALSIVTFGALLGALAISGYYEPRATDVRRQAAIASGVGVEGAAVSRLSLRGRHRFVTIREDEPVAPPVNVRTSAKLPAAKPEAKDRPAPRPKRPRQAAAPWPWSMFDN